MDNYFEQFYGSAILDSNVISYTDPYPGWSKAWTWSLSTGTSIALPVTLAHANYMLYVSGNPWTSPQITKVGQIFATLQLHFALLDPSGLYLGSLCFGIVVSWIVTILDCGGFEIWQIWNVALFECWRFGVELGQPLGPDFGLFSGAILGWSIVEIFWTL